MVGGSELVYSALKENVRFVEIRFVLFVSPFYFQCGEFRSANIIAEPAQICLSVKTAVFLYETVIERIQRRLLFGEQFVCAAVTLNSDKFIKLLK